MKAPSLRILFATPECAPWVKTGGLGDVCGALPKALSALGHDVRVLIPAFAAFKALLPTAKEVLPLPAQGPWPASRLLRVDERGVQLWLLDCPQLYDRPCGPYIDHTGRDFADNAERFGLLSHVAALLAGPASPCSAWQADVLHCHDWTTALAPAYLKEAVKVAPPGAPAAATVLTIHNLLFQGMFASHLAPTLAMPPHWLTVEEGLLHWDRLCFLKGGLRFADRITTVSPTYAQEIQQAQQGCGLDGMLRLRAADLTGILNGIDTDEWNPAKDTLIASTYDAERLDLKGRNKAALQATMGLPVKDETMLLGLVGRLTRQKGIELIIDAMQGILAMDCQLCMLGSGDADLEAQLVALAAAHPGRIAVRIGFDEALAHLIEAGADAFLMPSIFEPCGLNQMYSQAYGTPPIVHAVGGLADSVKEGAKGTNGNNNEEGGNGFVFHTPAADALLAAIRRAHALYRKPQAWQGIQRNAMALDRGWLPSARQYEAIYSELI